MSALDAEWRLDQLTSGGPEGPFHAHSYYDIPVFDAESRRIAAHRMGFAGRWMNSEDAVAVGWVDAERGGFEPLGESRAWSWQQGPMAQWVPGSRKLVWNDREEGRFVARLHDLDSGATTTLPRPVYALDPTGRFALSLNMARLDEVRPGYGYVGGTGAGLDRRRPRDDGVWRVDVATGREELILPIARAAAFLMERSPLRTRLEHLAKRYVYWFNHAKISPDGRRFTVKLRFRTYRGGARGPWNDRMGASLTCGVDGSDLRLLAWGASHVIWREDAETLYFWQKDRVRLYRDEAPEGRRLGELAPDLIEANVHIRHLATEPDVHVFDTPYREEIDLLLWNARDGARRSLARFGNHRPKGGPFRCDLHPVPSPDGRKIVATSLQPGGRQIFVLTRD